MCAKTLGSTRADDVQIAPCEMQHCPGTSSTDHGASTLWQASLAVVCWTLTSHLDKTTQKGGWNGLPTSQSSPTASELSRNWVNTDNVLAHCEIVDVFCGNVWQQHVVDSLYHNREGIPLLEGALWLQKQWKEQNHTDPWVLSQPRKHLRSPKFVWGQKGSSAGP